jgi:hypothetical protein
LGISTIRISIDSLSVSGLNQRELSRFESAFRSELHQLVTQTGSSHWKPIAGHDKFSSHESVLTSPENLGRNAAATVFQEVRRGSL